jgi:hypothetical protein
MILAPVSAPNPAADGILDDDKALQPFTAPIDKPLPAVSEAGEARALSESSRDADHERQRTEPSDYWRQWFIIDEESDWSSQELAMVREALVHSFAGLATVGLSGPDILDGYRFRRYDGEFVDERQGYVALVDHDLQEIVLPDVAFLRLSGFGIYHEIGHVIDSQLNRELSKGYHLETRAVTGSKDDLAVTADGFWMRPFARDDREEAAADAFALWVTVDHAGMKRPIFAGTPLDVQYEGIAEAMEQALLAIGE